MRYEYEAVCDMCGKEESGTSKDNFAVKGDTARSYFERKGWMSHGEKAYCRKCSEGEE